MKILKLIISIFILFFFSFNISNADVGTDFNNLLKAEYDLSKYPYAENRNDVGIFYEFDFDYKDKIIKLKRTTGNYPIVRFSLFEKKKNNSR